MRSTKKNILLLIANILVILLLFCSHYWQQARHAEALRSLSEANAQLSQLEDDVYHLKMDLAFKTHPATIDSSLRTWFEGTLKSDPDQVRGVDGKFPRER